MEGHSVILVPTACAQMHLCLNSGRCSNFFSEGSACFKAYSLQCLVNLRSPWPLEDKHVCLSQESCTSQGHRCWTHCISLHHLSGCQDSQAKTQDRRQSLVLSSSLALKHLRSIQDPIPAVLDTLLRSKQWVQWAQKLEAPQFS